MQPADRTYRNMVLRITDLAVNEDVLADLTFENCNIVGPAVLAPLDGTVISNTTWDAPDLDAVLWVIPSERLNILGAIGLLRCTLVGCRFQRIGIAIPEAQLDDVREGFSAS